MAEGGPADTRIVKAKVPRVPAKGEKLMHALVENRRNRVVDLRVRQSGAPAKQKVGTVFLVEAEVKTETSLRSLFSAAGISAESFSSGRDFLDALEDDDRGCVLLNMRLFDIDCATVLEALATRRIAMPAILYSGIGKPLSVVQPLPTNGFEADGAAFGLAVLDRVTRAMAIGERMRVRRGEADRANARIRSLTKRELEIAQLVVAGKANKVIAADLGISGRTVEIHRARIMRKTQSDSLAALVWLFAAAGLTPTATSWPTEELRNFLTTQSCDGEH